MAKIRATDRKEANTETELSDSPENPTIGLIIRFQRFTWDLIGVGLLAISLMTLVVLVTPGLARGTLLTAWGIQLHLWLGWGSYLVVIATTLAGLLVLRMRVDQLRPVSDHQENLLAKIPWSRVFALEFAAFSALALLTIAGGASIDRAESGQEGGRIGWGLTELTKTSLARFGLTGEIWGILILTMILFICLIYGLGLSGRIGRVLRDWIETEDERDTVTEEPGVSVAPVGDQEGATIPAKGGKKRRTKIPPEFQKNFKITSKDESSSTPKPRDENLPPLDLLVDEQTSRPDERNINQLAGLIEKTLDDFGIPAKVIGFRVGPTVTQFAVEPGFVDKGGSEEDPVKQKVRVSQISALRRDLALALSAERLRIEAPVPGRPYVGIEVPNVRTSVVRLRPILETDAFYKTNSPLSIILGRDVSGHPVIADLMSMPHLLIAGTTGSGKSVCIAALTTCMVMNNSPEDLRLVMIDPKMVELVRFNGLPHLHGKVETDIQRILGVLRWVTIEMDRRYMLLEETRSRHIDSYNRKMRRRKGGEILPRIVVMIDELADLMMTAPDQTEHNLIRLAQMARATGIHLVVATQRPSTDVVTGLIKANFPARISFAVASSVDSRVILDSAGAESLLGHGDMLFLPPEAPAPIRSQGVMVSDPEVEKVITWWQGAFPIDESTIAPWEVMLAEEEMLADRDELVVKAIEIVRQTQRASTSLLQRRLRVGYPRAARLMDELEDMGIVGPSQGGGREREVLIDPDTDLSDV
jgi:S-DNA-T family DNA segregation ATPase FtsK/SpoIIIE